MDLRQVFCERVLQGAAKRTGLTGGELRSMRGHLCVQCGISPLGLCGLFRGSGQQQGVLQCAQLVWNFRQLGALGRQGRLDLGGAPILSVPSRFQLHPLLCAQFPIRSGVLVQSGGRAGRKLGLRFGQLLCAFCLVSAQGGRPFRRGSIVAPLQFRLKLNLLFELSLEGGGFLLFLVQTLGHPTNLFRMGVKLLDDGGPIHPGRQPRLSAFEVQFKPFARCRSIRGQPQQFILR